MEKLKGLNLNDDPELRDIVEGADPTSDNDMIALSRKLLPMFESGRFDYIEWHAPTSEHPNNPSTEGSDEGPKP